MEFKNEISWMDILVALGILGTVALLVFDVKEDVAVNSNDIVRTNQIVAESERRITGDLRKVEREAAKDRDQILEAIGEIRVESGEGRRRIEDKLDRLIERKLDERN